MARGAWRVARGALHIQSHKNFKIFYQFDIDLVKQLVH